MDLDHYQKAADVTAVYEGHGTGTWQALAYAALGAAGEAGEIANKVKKVNRDDGMEVTPERKEAILGEVGGCLWYLAAVCTELQTSLTQVAKANILQLADRSQRDALWGDGDNR